MKIILEDKYNQIYRFLNNKTVIQIKNLILDVIKYLNI